jgi:predicted phage-related endonuclease
MSLATDRIQRITPTSRAAWHVLRAQDITASVVGALVGEHEFVTLFELWARKTGRLSSDEGESPAMQRGRLLEPVAVQLIREQHPDWKIEHNAAANVYYRDPAARLGGTPDVIVTDAPGRGRGVIQIKSVEASVYRRKWLVEGEPEVPTWIALQAAVEAYLTGARWAAVAPLVVGHGLEMPLIEVGIPDGLVDAIKEKVAEFWQMVAEGREPVADPARDGKVIDRLFAHGDGRAEVDLSTNNRFRELIETRAAALAAANEHHRTVEQIDAEVKLMMGNATVAHIGDGRRITWENRHRAGFAAPAISYRFLKYPKQQ